MEVITDRKIVYTNNPDLETEMNDEYSYFPDKPKTSKLNIPEFKLTKDKKDTIIPQFRTETKTDLRKETFGTKKPIVIEPKKEQVIATENVEVISEKQGMGLGAKIGIGIGALVILGLGVYLIRKNK